MRTYKEFVAILESGQWSGQANFRYGSTPATSTDKSVSSAVDKALAKPGTSQSASQTTGRTGLTGSGSLQYSGTMGSKPQPQPVVTKPVVTKPVVTKPVVTKPVQPLKSSPPRFSAKTYQHADPKVNERLQNNPKLLNRAVELANQAASRGGKDQRLSGFYNNAIVDGKPINPAQAKMTSRAREMAGPNAVAGLTFTYGDASHRNDRQAQSGQYKSWKASRESQ